jgi:hypothetical protein
MGLAAAESSALIRLKDREVRRFLDEKWRIVEEQFAPEHFILFGSRINGTPREDSDIDLVIVSAVFRDIRFIWRSDFFRERINPHIITTALCCTPEEFAEMRTGIGVVPDACREGVWIR